MRSFAEVVVTLLSVLVAGAIVVGGIAFSIAKVVLVFKLLFS